MEVPEAFGHGAAISPPYTLRGVVRTRRPPGPPGHPLLGHIPQVRRDTLGFMTRTAHEYGDLVALRFGPSPGLLVSHPHAIEQILVTDRRRFVKGVAYRIIARLTGHGLLTSEGDTWRRSRRLMQPAFHRERIASYADVMVSYAGRTAGRWSARKTVDVHEEMMRLTLEVVAKTLFDADVTVETEAKVGDAMKTALESGTRILQSLSFLLPNAIPTPANLRVRGARRRLDRIIYRLIADRRSRGEIRGDLLSLLLEARDEGAGKMTDRWVRDQAMTLFLAGHETTAIGLTWAFYLLSRHPDVAEKLGAELDLLGNRSPTVHDLPQLRYTRMIVEEALRLYPPAFAISRRPLGAYELEGYRVRRGTNIVMSQWVVHRDPRFFKEPDAFRPERWDGNLAERLPAFAYFPFGGGQRLCIGRSFAMMEAVLILATIARRHRLELVGDREVIPEAALTLRPKGGLYMNIHAR